MVAKVRWSDNAIQDYKNVIDYLLLEWNEQIALKFIEILEYKLLQIEKHPYLGILSSKDAQIRSVSITKHNRLYYRIHDRELLEVVNIFDTRQHPDKNSFD